MMKYRIAALLFCTALVASELSANPFIGRWKIDLVDTANPVIIEFLDDTVYSLIEVNVNETQYQDYSIDEKSQILDLGTINEMKLTVRYSINEAGDSFSLYFSDEMINDQFLGSLDMGFGNENSSSEMSDFTKEFMEKFRKGMFDLMRALPIGIGKRIKASQ
jgi:hypothetical protein